MKSRHEKTEGQQLVFHNPSKDPHVFCGWLTARSDEEERAAAELLERDATQAVARFGDEVCGDLLTIYAGELGDGSRFVAYMTRIAPPEGWRILKETKLEACSG